VYTVSLFSRPLWVTPVVWALLGCALANAIGNDPLFRLAGNPHAEPAAAVLAFVIAMALNLAYSARKRLPPIVRRGDRLLAQPMLFDTGCDVDEDVTLRLERRRIFGRRMLTLMVEGEEFDEVRISEEHRGFGSLVFGLSEETGVPLSGEAPAPGSEAEATLLGLRDEPIERDRRYQATLLGALTLLAAPVCAVVAAAVVFEVFTPKQPGAAPGEAAVWAAPITAVIAMLVSRLVLFPLLRRRAVHRAAPSHSGMI
jgi:uncharacterized membrane protein